MAMIDGGRRQRRQMVVVGSDSGRLPQLLSQTLSDSQWFELCD